MSASRRSPGEITSVIGPNGAGKTTALNLICGFYRPDAGTVRLGDRDIAGLPAYHIRAAGVARTYQTTQLFAIMSVIDNVLVALRRGRLAPARCSRRSATGDDRAIAESLLAFVGYSGRARSRLRARSRMSTSGWSRSRARSPLRPSVLLLDEPAAGLNEDDTAALGELLAQARARRHRS